MAVGVWCAYTLGIRLRAPEADQGRAQSIAALESVDRILREEIEQERRGADFQDGPAAALGRTRRLRAAYEEARGELTRQGPQALWAKRNLTSMDAWAAGLSQAEDLLAAPTADDERKAVEREVRARGQLMLAEVRTTLAELKNPPYEAFMAERRQTAFVALTALCLTLLVAIFLIYDAWARPGAASRLPSLTALPWAEEALKSLPEGILTLDEQLRVRWANHAAHVLLGYGDGDLQGLSANAIFPATNARGGAPGFVAQNGRLTETARRRDGGTFLSRFHVVRTPQRTLVLFRKFVEERVDQNARAPVDVPRLREENEVLSDLLRHAPWPLAVFDSNGRISRLNVAAEELIDFSAGEVKGHPYWEMLLPESHWSAAVDRWTELGELHQAQVAEEPWCPRFGDPIPLRWSRTGLLDRNGQLRYVIAAAERVTEPATAPPAYSEELVDRLTEVAGYAELALLTSTDQNGARGDLERLRSAAEKAIGLCPPAVRN